MSLRRHSLVSVLVALLGGAADASGSLAGDGALAPAGQAMPATADRVGAVLEQLGAEERRTEDRLALLTREADRVHSLIVERGRAYTKLARAGLLPLGGGLEALVDHAAKLERLRRSIAQDLERERAIADERRTLGAAREALRVRQDVLSTEREALARSHTAILAAEEREAAFRRAFLGEGPAVAHTAVYGSASGALTGEDLERGFPALRGRLPFPVEGRVEIRESRRSGGEPGLDMTTPSGARVGVVFPGRVAFADDYADLGKTVLVDHGGGYFTVTSRLSAIDVRVGETVAPGDRLGAAWGTLRLEIRRGGRAVDPGPWFGI
ncbi:MAG: peptidoglycan DD-metalloendopeptidase family protein [Deltaproteobacteria bacterium]|nr:peptidoglycan DD-metalloendopeptidase family protein [Deltaproteobacteria bacterium]